MSRYKRKVKKNSLLVKKEWDGGKKSIVKHMIKNNICHPIEADHVLDELDKIN